MPRLALLALAPLALLAACQSSDGPLSLFQQELTLGYAGPGTGPSPQGGNSLRALGSGGRAAIRGGVTAGDYDPEAGAPPASRGVYDVDLSSVTPAPEEVARMNAAIDSALAEHRDLPALPIARTIEIGSIRTALKDAADVAADAPPPQTVIAAPDAQPAEPASL